MKQKNIIVAIVAVVVIASLGFVVVGRKGQRSVAPSPNQTQNDAIPTVDASVKVNLKKIADNSVTLSVEGMPTDTTSLDYTLSYDTKSQGAQGIIGDGIKITPDKRTYEATRFLGTRSSGHSVYHEVVGPIKLEIKFTGRFGERIFVHEYTL